MSFQDLGLGPDVLRAVADAGYTEPTPIQRQAIPQVLAGRDVLGCAQTGTGKTASFTLPMIDILFGTRARARMPRSLIIEPTRELAAQVAENFDIYGKYHKLTKALLIGGVQYSDQEKVLDRGVDVLIATPGRLLDHFERGRLLLSDVKLLVIDEADRMLDMGFIPDVERIVSLLPKSRQTLFFSATMPPEIRRLADAFLSNPKEITVSRPATTATTVTQGIVVCDDRQKREVLRTLLQREPVKNALIFCNRKRDVDVLYKSLKRHGFNAGQLHGDMDQGTRTATLESFKRGEITLLVCSDVAARGLDIDDMSHVFNFDVPIHAEDYVHRIGRTGRAGRSGAAFTIATPEDTKFVRAIEKLITQPIPKIALDIAPPPPRAEGEAEGERGRRGDRDRGRGRGRGSRPDRPRRHESASGAEPAAPIEAQLAPPSPSPDVATVSAAVPTAAPTAPAAAAAPAAPKAHAPRAPRRHAPPAEPRTPQAQRKTPARDDDDDGTPFGKGENVPAFLMRGRRATG
ncbi:MAG: DEAD/DEAH box helicase [Alphaproteobacteria bacterium]|nr:DEAD/DEAH box helicase [Alphaproteobacteria bacterium]